LICANLFEIVGLERAKHSMGQQTWQGTTVRRQQAKKVLRDRTRLAAQDRPYEILTAQYVRNSEPANLRIGELLGGPPSEPNADSVSGLLRSRL
jgi:hypothetical protein